MLIILSINLYAFLLIASWLELLQQLNGYCLNDTRCPVLSLCVFILFPFFACAYFMIGVWAVQ
jgi:hypothetical protein